MFYVVVVVMIIHLIIIHLLMPRKRKKPEYPFPGVNESMAEYLNGPSYKESFRRIEISSPEEQEQANRIFSANLTPLQRLELLQ